MPPEADALQIDAALLERFEAALDPSCPAHSALPAQILGYGEISSIFKIPGGGEVAFKRLPLFANLRQAQTYVARFETYCRHLGDAGLQLPPYATALVALPGRPVVLYIAQACLPQERFAHRLIHDMDRALRRVLFETVVAAIEGVWRYNAARRPLIELSLDGQLSNWVLPGAGGAGNLGLLFVDTSTPLHRIEGREQMDPELLLQSAPGFLRWILRLFFLQDVMERYYRPRAVYIDLAANLYKEQRPELIGEMLAIINAAALSLENPITASEVRRYYREDRLIWTLFLAFRRVDRWLRRHLLRRRYEFILPGPIRR
jgi:hypothetical protein